MYGICILWILTLGNDNENEMVFSIDFQSTGEEYFKKQMKTIMKKYPREQYIWRFCIQPVGEAMVEILCRENDNWLRLYYVDGRLDEMHISDALKKAWIVVGEKDIITARKSVIVK